MNRREFLKSTLAVALSASTPTLTAILARQEQADFISWNYPPSKYPIRLTQKTISVSGTNPKLFSPEMWRQLAELARKLKEDFAADLVLQGAS